VAQWLVAEPDGTMVNHNSSTQTKTERKTKQFLFRCAPKLKYSKIHRKKSNLTKLKKNITNLFTAHGVVEIHFTSQVSKTRNAKKPTMRRPAERTT
jgi:hypothetical protein